MLKIELIFTMLLKKKLILMIEYNVASTRNADEIKKLIQAEKADAMYLVWEIFLEFEAPDYVEEGINTRAGLRAAAACTDRYPQRRKADADARPSSVPRAAHLRLLLPGLS